MEPGTNKQRLEQEQEDIKEKYRKNKPQLVVLSNAPGVDVDNSLRIVQSMRLEHVIRATRLGLGN